MVNEFGRRIQKKKTPAICRTILTGIAGAISINSSFFRRRFSKGFLSPPVPELLDCRLSRGFCFGNGFRCQSFHFLRTRRSLHFFCYRTNRRDRSFRNCWFSLFGTVAHHRPCDTPDDGSDRSRDDTTHHRTSDGSGCLFCYGQVWIASPIFGFCFHKLSFVAYIV